MLLSQMRTPADALAYMTDCTLGTVCRMAMKKRRNKYEYERQIAIAETGVRCMEAMGVSFAGTRADQARHFGSVAGWAKQYEPTDSQPAAEAP